MDPQNSVRIKYTSEEKIEARTTGGVVPRIGEKICLVSDTDPPGVFDRDWFEVEDVWWTVQADSAERKPDVVEVRLAPISDDGGDEVVYVADPEQMPLCEAELVFQGDSSGGIHGCHEQQTFECIECGTVHRFVRQGEADE